jgi:hypothetical protein
MDSDDPTSAELRCEVCRAPVDDIAALSALLPDCAAVHPHDPRLDGRSLVTVCGWHHLELLRARYAARPFIDEELWAGQLARALRSDRLRGQRRRRRNGRDPLDQELAKLTGLTVDQVHRALAWRRARIAVASER